MNKTLIVCVSIVCVSLSVTVCYVGGEKRSGDVDSRLKMEETRLKLEELKFKQSELDREKEREAEERQVAERGAAGRREREIRVQQERENAEIMRKKKEQETALRKEEQERLRRIEIALNTQAYVNHINSVVETIRSYNNVIVLMEEYNALSDNLDLDKIVMADEEVKESIKAIMDKLHEFMKKESEWKQFKEGVDGRRERAKLQQWAKFWKGGVDSLEQGVKDASAAVDAAHIANVNPYMAGIRGAVAAVKEFAKNSIDCYFDYQSAVAELRDEVKRKKYELGEEKKDELHVLNKEMLDRQVAWQKKYYGVNGFGDLQRVTPGEVGELIEKIKKTRGVNTGNYKVLMQMKEKFPSFPMYWYYLALSAVEANEYREALLACQQFEKVNRGLFRYDKMARGAAIAKISAMLGLDEVDKDEIGRLIGVVEHNNWKSDDVDASYFAASVCHSVLGDSQRAKRILEAAMFSLEGRYTQRLKDYADLFGKSLNEVKGDVQPPVFFDLAKCRALRAEIEQGTGKELPVQVLRKVCELETTSSYEKLYYVGKLRVEDLWVRAKQDVEDIKVWFKPKSSSVGGQYVVQFPISWVILGDMRPKLAFYMGKKKIGELQESKRYMGYDNLHGKGRVVRVLFDVNICKLNSFCSEVRLTLDNAAWPVEIEYEPHSGVNVMSGEFRSDDDRAYFTAKRLVSFMGEAMNKDLLDHKGFLAKEFPSDKIDDMGQGKVAWAVDNAMYAFRFADKQIPVGRCGIMALDCSLFKSNGLISVEYCNDSNYARYIEVGVKLTNQSGAILLGYARRRKVMPFSKGRFLLRRSRVQGDYLKGLDPVLGFLSCLWSDSPNDRKSDVFRSFENDSIEGAVTLARIALERFRRNGDFYLMDQSLGGNVLREGEEKLRNAAEEMNIDLGSEKVVALYDSTFFGKGDEGFVLTDRGIHWSGEGVGFLAWRDLKSCVFLSGYLLVNGRRTSQVNHVDHPDLFAEAILKCKEIFSPPDVITDVFDASSMSDDGRYRKFIVELFAQSGIADGIRSWVATEGKVSCGSLTNALAEVNGRWNTSLSSSDALVFIDESADRDGREGVVLTDNAFYYFRKRNSMWIRFDDIESVDWERSSGGSVFVNGVRCNFIVNKRKPFVDAFRRALFLAPSTYLN